MDLSVFHVVALCAVVQVLLSPARESVLITVLGTTNFDHRSFGLNDEVNVAIQDSALAGRLEQDFRADIASSREVSVPEWRRRGVAERMLAGLGALLERHQ